MQKDLNLEFRRTSGVRVRTHRAPKGALRRAAARKTGTRQHRQEAPSAIRCIKTSLLWALDTDVKVVRKQLAPKGALRRVMSDDERCRFDARQKAPSAKRCIKTHQVVKWSHSTVVSQKAPSAKRCIKTVVHDEVHQQSVLGQKPPSAKRCIKTHCLDRQGCNARRVRKHRTPKGALRLDIKTPRCPREGVSESTEHHKVHSDTRQHAPNSTHPLGARKHRASQDA